MPEAPELEVAREFLAERITGQSIAHAEVIKPSVLRPLAAALVPDVVGRTVAGLERRGKFLLLRLSDDRALVVNPMLTGGFQYCPPSERLFKKTCLLFGLSNGRQLRYLDDRQMGRVYYVRGSRIDEVPQIAAQGPDVLTPMALEEFRQRLRGFRGEIKGVLTRGRVVSGIGNAYADEILFEARIYPYRKCGQLTEDETRRLHAAARSVAAEAVKAVRERTGDRIHVKNRDFLKVHNRGGEPCPRCDGRISEVTANRRITSYCRRCQPGLLVMPTLTGR